jgi:hypothetical protein
MRYLAGGPHLAVELGETDRIVAKPGWKQLERHRLAESQVVGTIDFSHTARAEQSDDPVATVEYGARRETAVID